MKTKKINPKNILILGDSCCFGRPSHGITKDDTWPFLLKKKLGSELIFRANGSSTLLDLNIEARRLRDGWFDIKL